MPCDLCGCEEDLCDIFCVFDVDHGLVVCLFNKPGWDGQLCVQDFCVVWCAP